MRISSTMRQIRPFNLMRWFSVTALLSIALVSILAALAFSAFLTKRMIQQEAEISAGFIRSIVATENAYSYFDGSQSATTTELQNFLDHINRMPNVLRTNVYSADYRMIWSSDRSLIGQRFERNDELEEALRADLVVHSGITDPAHLPKSEHQHLANAGKRFVESYVPIFDVHGRQVVGVVEIYKVPDDLFEAIETGVRLIWLVTAGAGVFLYGTLFWIIHRAHGIIEAQSDQLIENESLAVVGEMGSAVAHGLRNPLASIRSSAELSLESPLPPEARESAQDIIGQVDRLEGWIRQLLTYAKPSHANLGAVDINAVLQESMQSYSRDLERRHIKLSQNLAGNLPNVRGDSAVLCQLVGSLIANAMEAQETGGEIILSSQLADNGMVVAEIRDSGPGISPNDMKLIFKPFFTNKTKGLGLGLPLVRRVVERLGGKVEVDSAPGQGTAVRLYLPIWK
jgi:two-component system, NtrC family, sensor histidine kinase HydH